MMQTKPPRTLLSPIASRFPALLLCLCLLWAAAGCQLGTMIAKPIFGDDKVKAAFHPADQSTLVFVDDPRSAVRDLQTLNIIAAQAGFELTKAKVITNVVDPAALNELRLNTPDFDQWPLDRIGKQVGAHQVLYVMIDSFAPLGTGGDEVRRPNAKVRIKLVHVQSGVSLFPTSGEHGVNTVLSFPHDVYSGASPALQKDMTRKLAERVGLSVARVFYDHAPHKVGHGFDQ